MQMLGVGSTTVKRWADDGTLPCTRTAGGHRRFPRDAVDRLLWHHRAAGKDALTGEFYDLLIEEGDVMKIRDRIGQLRDELGEWYRVADFLNNVMSEMWSNGLQDDESIARSQIASGRLGLALSAVKRSFAPGPTAPIVLLATLTDLRHSHKLALADFCASSEGMEIFKAPEKTSPTELADQIRSWEQHLVVLCVAEQCMNCDLLDDAYKVILTACEEQGVEFAMGFAGKCSNEIGHSTRFQSFEELTQILRQVKRTTESASGN
jgi:excisionase family DNA binding protein